MTALDIKVEEEERKKDTVGILLAAKIPLFSANGAPIVAFVAPIPAIVRRSHANNRDSTTVVARVYRLLPFARVPHVANANQTYFRLHL